MQLRNASLPVLVLPMDHYGSLGVMRSLGRLGVPVYGAHPTPRPIASFSTYCRKVFELDLDALPQAESVDAPPGYRPRVRRQAAFDCDQRRNRHICRTTTPPRFSKASCFADNSTQLVWSLYNKKDMYFLAKQLSIPTAETVFPESRKDVLEFCEKAQFPVMLKASDNIRVAQPHWKKDGDRQIQGRTHRSATTPWKTAAFQA